MTAKQKKAQAKAKATRAANVAAVAEAVNLKKVGKVQATDAGKRAEFNADAKIVVLPAGKENPRREGTARWKRYEDLRKSGTVGEFLKKHPRWNSTITRCVIEKLIELR
jgi:hypothetical protein